MNAIASKQKIRTMIWRMVAGGVVGAAATVAFLFAVEPRIDLNSPSSALAIIAGLSYALIGLSVGFGLIAPNAGARFLNVEDPDELREEGPKLRIGAVCCFLIGAFLLLLALGGGSAMTMTAGACLVGLIVLTLLASRRNDELTRQISLEASAATLHIALVGIGAWALLNQLGLTGAIDSLGLIAALAFLELVAIFVVSARRGLMIPR